MANEFNLGDPKGKVAYWSCTLENHVNGGEHYHLSLKLTGPRRSFSVRNALQRLHKKHLGMLLDFRASWNAFGFGFFGALETSTKKSK